MVRIDTNNNQSANQANSTTDNQTGQNNQTPTKDKGLMTIIGQLLPLAPFAFEQFTGQKVPALTGTIAEMQMALISIQTTLQTMATNQQQLNQRLMALETNATHHLNNLTQQFQSFRLTHTKEHKEIDFNRPLEQNQDPQN
jgi:hypothetical protein